MDLPTFALLLADTKSLPEMLAVSEHEDKQDSIIKYLRHVYTCIHVKYGRVKT